MDVSFAQYAAKVVSFDPAATGALGYDNPTAAIGPPERFTGEGSGFDAVVSPFNSPYLATEIVSIGEGGHLTLRLSKFAVPQPAGPEIGVFANVGFADADFPNGQFDAPFTTFGVDRAVVEVSEQGTAWTSLGEVEFDIPTNGYADAAGPFAASPGNVEADFQQPFVGSLSDFQGLRYSDPGAADMLDLLNGSGGGTWLDISATGLARVGYVRFVLPDDGDPGTLLNFELDAVSIAHGAVGAAVPEPSTLWLAMFSAAALAAGRRAA